MLQVRPPRARSQRTPNPLPWVVVSVLVLSVLFFVRSRLNTRVTVQREPAARTERMMHHAAPSLGDYVRYIAPAWRSARCATEDCHGARTSPWVLLPMPEASEVLDEYSRTVALSAARDLSSSVLWQRAHDGHSGSAALDREGCFSRALEQWINGRGVVACEGDSGR